MAILAEKKRKEKKLLDAKVFKNPGSYIFSRVYSQLLTQLFKFIVIDTHTCFALKKHAALGGCGY